LAPCSSRTTHREDVLVELLQRGIRLLLPGDGGFRQPMVLSRLVQLIVLRVRLQFRARHLPPERKDHDREQDQVREYRDDERQHDAALLRDGAGERHRGAPV
jgi:hypothetical protein